MFIVRVCTAHVLYIRIAHVCMPKEARLTRPYCIMRHSARRILIACWSLLSYAVAYAEEDAASTRRQQRPSVPDIRSYLFTD